MPVITTIGAMSARGFGEFNQQAEAKYIENYFSTYLYTGSGNSQFINNNIPLTNTLAWYTYTLTQSAATSARSVATDSSGNVYVAGTGNDGSNYIILAKYNPAGVLQWQRKLNQGSSPDAVGYVALDSSGNPYIAGRIGLYCAIAKYNSSGVLQWQRKLENFVGTITPKGITIDSSNNILITGIYFDSTGPDLYMFVVKYNSSGTIQWQRQFYSGPSGKGEGFGVATDSSGNVYVTGEDNQITLNKYNSSGTLQWQKKLTYGTASSGRGITIDSLDNIYIVAANSSSTSPATIPAIALIKCNTSGAIQWTTALTGVTSTSIDQYGVTTDASNNIYITGSLTDSTIPYMLAAKYDSSGTIQWQRKIYRSSSAGYNLSTDNLGNLYIAGRASSTAVLVKLTADGTTISGTAFVSMFIGNAAASTPTIVASDNTGTDFIGIMFDSAGTATDSAAGATSTIYTQESVFNSGGLVWIKSRDNSLNNNLYDTIRGSTKLLVSNATSAQATQAASLTNFSASGFEIGSFGAVNTNAATFASWTFRKSSRFFDVITYTGTGSVQNISHNLNSIPGMIIIKRTNASGAWPVYHRSNTNTNVIFFNTDAARITDSTYWNNTTPTNKVFTVGTNNDVNASGSTYVAYLFASDAGGFGLDTGQSVITCGSYVGNGSATGPSVVLGYEPQLVIIKSSTGVGNWNIIDNMRRFNSNGADAILLSNTTAIESNTTAVAPNSNGFSIATSNSEFNSNGVGYIYMAIRRGPMKIPSSGTSVFLPKTELSVTGTASATNFVVDSQWKFIRAGNVLNTAIDDRLRGVSTTSTGSGQYVITSSTSAQATTNATTLNWNNTGYSIPAYYTNVSSVFYNFQRAPNFMDVVCYDGSAAAANIAHNLRAAPELMFVKRTNGNGSWYVYHSALGNTKYAVLETTAAPVTSISAWNDTSPNANVFTIGTNANVNGSGSKFVAYLFASCPNVSKVGTYTGTGSTLTVDCGLASGVRYVMIKRSDNTGDWFFWDTARGMVAGTDPRGAYNLTTAETNANWVYTTATGFEVVSTDATVNANGGTYIYLAIA